jgi:hypothetical protein
MQDDEQTIVEVTPNLRLFERYWGWEIRLDGDLIGSVVSGPRPRPVPHLGVYVVTYRTNTAHVVVDRLISFEQVVEYLRVNEGYLR